MATQMDERDYRTARMLRALSRVVDAQAHRNGLRPYHLDALRFFAEQPASGGTVAGFARSHRLSVGRASPLVSQLIEQGYLRIAEAPEEAGDATLELTDRGRQALEVDPLMALAEAVAELPAEQRAAFRDGVESLCRRVSKEE
jgi:DNA-binding MarR family transcriptional regulator